MKFVQPSVLLAMLATSPAHGADPSCREIMPGSAPDSLGVKVTPVNSIPVDGPEGGYNSAVYENIHGKTYFVDNKAGIIWTHDDDSNNVRVLYDVAEDPIPDGVDINVRGAYVIFGNMKKKIHAVSAGPRNNEIIVVFPSTTLPPGVPAVPLPPDPEYHFADDGDCSPSAIDASCGNRDTIYDRPWCCIAQNTYKLFYKFRIQGNKLKSPKLVFAYEMQITYGHDGGAMAAVPDGRILWGVGDCLPFGVNGLSAPQDPSNLCGKIVLIDPEDPGSYRVAALGVRNTQQMFVEGDMVYFMDVGGVTAEEVNAIPLADLLDPDTIPNFGWGEAGGCEDFAREGTFIVETGTLFADGAPACIDEQRSKEKMGFVLPYLQFGNANDDPTFFGISGALVSPVSFDTIKVAGTVFSTGVFIAGLEDYSGDPEGDPTAAYHVKMYKDDGAGGLEELTSGFNDLVADFLGGDPGRGDPRMFRYPDGTAGVFLERTGAFYRLEEIHVE